MKRLQFELIFANSSGVNTKPRGAIVTEKMPGPILILVFRPNVLKTFPGHDKISFMVVVRKSVLFVIVKFCNS